MLKKVHHLLILFALVTAGLSLLKLSVFLWERTDLAASEVDLWLQENDLGQYSEILHSNGISTLETCGSPEQVERLPELPAADETRLRHAALILQQRLILREWLSMHDIHHVYSKLVSLDVSSLEDVYWAEDSMARLALSPRDFNIFSHARRTLPTAQEGLVELKQDLWSTVIKNSAHRDAWTWGGMLVISVSVAGLVTLAAMTQPSLAPEAKHSLLQYVTGKYLYPPNCKVIWGWNEPQAVGATMCFSVQFYQRNGNPYPICDTDEFCATICHGTQKVSSVIELGSSTDPNSANIAKVMFTVRIAGNYIISVMIDSMHVSGSPFRRAFSAGPVDPKRSAVGGVGAGIGGGGGGVVCARRTPHVLYVYPRDSHNNLCVQTDAEGYDLKVSLLGCPTDPLLSKCALFAYDCVNQRVALNLFFEDSGIYHATLSYEGVTLQNGEFECIVLTASEAATVQKNVSAKSHNICYEAKLLSNLNGSTEKPAKPRKVLCYISPKQLTLKEMILKIIPKRLITFRLCPSTKLIFCSGSGVQGNNGVFIVDDGTQPPVELSSPDRDVIAATFTQFLLKNIGGSESFKDKQDFFYFEVRKLHNKYSHEKLPMRVCRESLVQSSFKATKHFSIADWCRNFDITFQGEQGVDWGGVRREWFSLLCSKLFDPQYGLFASFIESPSGLVHPNPSRPVHLKLKYFELAGKLVGKCLYESAFGSTYRQLVRARFTRSFLAQIIGLRVHYKHFEQDDPELYLSKIKYILETDLNNQNCATAELCFSEDIYDAVGRLVGSVDLIPNGAKIKVCNGTKHRYLDALAQYRLASRCKEEIESFLRGLNMLIPDNLLSIFDENELELLVCGTGEVCVLDWRAHSIVALGSDRKRELAWFWAAVTNFSTEERARLLQFSTGCSQLPPGGFQDLNPRFQLTAAPTYGALPTAHTCFNQLCLPEYDSYELLVNALLWAINEGSEGFGMI